MLESHRITQKFVLYGLQMRDGAWSPDLRAAVSPVHLQDLDRVAYGVDLAARVSLFTYENPSQIQVDLRPCIEALLTFTGVGHDICICETHEPTRERCFQFASGLSLVFVHQCSLRAPYAGFLHEVLHGFGLTGVPEIDEGVAMLFEEAANGDMLSYTPEIGLNIEWCRGLARRQVSPANVYTFGSSYFAAIVEEKGIGAVWSERERLLRLADAEAIREHMWAHLTGVRSRDAPMPEGPVTSETLDELYFNGDLSSFSAGSLMLFDGIDPTQLPVSEQMTFARMVIYLSTLEIEEIPGSVQSLLHDDARTGLHGPVDSLIEIAQAIFAARHSQSRLALKKNSRKLERLLVAACDIPEIRADILLQLVQFHKYVPEIAGGDRVRASGYAAELATLPGMERVGQQMYDALREVSA